MEGPKNPFLRRFSQVRVFSRIRSQRKVFILGQNKESQTLLLQGLTSPCSECSSYSLASLRVKFPLPFMPHLSLSLSIAVLIFLCLDGLASPLCYRLLQLKCQCYGMTILSIPGCCCCGSSIGGPCTFPCSDIPF